LRDFGDGFVAVLLAVYLTELGLGAFEVGIISTAALLGSALTTLGIGVLTPPGVQRALLMFASALMTQVFASVFDKLLAEGKILSWGWNEHIVGGDYRRLSTISAKDTKTLMEARASIVEAIFDNPLGDTLTDLCGPHVDYVWDITSQNP
jgi:hypothetical protein